MSERFAKVERQVGKLLKDLDRMRRENVSLRAINSKLNESLRDRLDSKEKMETASARFLKMKEEHTRYKEERSRIRREARGLLRRVRAIKKGDIGK